MAERPGLRAGLGSRGRRLLRFEQVRFLLVGGLNTLLGFGIYLALVRLGVSFPLANLVSLVVGIAVSFVAQGRLVFGNADNRRFARFVLCWFAIYLAQTSVIALLVRAGMTPSMAGLVVLPGTALVSYVVNKLLVFRSTMGVQ